jgi:hypothetical protein
MLLSDAIRHYGSKAKLAQVLQVTRGAVSQWVSAGSLPPFRQLQLQAMTRGKLLAGLADSNRRKRKGNRRAGQNRKR